MEITFDDIIMSGGEICGENKRNSNFPPDKNSFFLFINVRKTMFLKSF